MSSSRSQYVMGTELSQRALYQLVVGPLPYNCPDGCSVKADKDDASFYLNHIYRLGYSCEDFKKSERCARGCGYGSSGREKQPTCARKPWHMDVDEQEVYIDRSYSAEISVGIGDAEDGRWKLQQQQQQQASQPSPPLSPSTSAESSIKEKVSELFTSIQKPVGIAPGTSLPQKDTSKEGARLSATHSPLVQSTQEGKPDSVLMLPGPEVSQRPAVAAKVLQAAADGRLINSSAAPWAYDTQPSCLEDPSGFPVDTPSTKPTHLRLPTELTATHPNELVFCHLCKLFLAPHEQTVAEHVKGKLHQSMYQAARAFMDPVRRTPASAIGHIPPNYQHRTTRGQFGQRSMQDLPPFIVARSSVTDHEKQQVQSTGNGFFDEAYDIVNPVCVECNVVVPLHMYKLHESEQMHKNICAAARKPPQQ